MPKANSCCDTPVVIIAAGRGRRFGTYPKILYNLNGKPIIHHILNNAIKAGVGNIFLVLGYKYKLVKSKVESFNWCVEKAKPHPKNHKLLTILYNKSWRRGKSSSIKIALKNIPKTSKGILILLGDMPYIKANMMAKVKKEFVKNNCKKIIYFGNKNNIGHPVMFPKKYFNELIKLKGEQGGKELIKKYIEDTVSIGRFFQTIQKDIDQKFANLDNF